jgi:hypothetical protein
MAEDQIFSARANARDAITGPGLLPPPWPARHACRAGCPGPDRPPGTGQARQPAPARAGVMTGPAKTSSSRKET